MISLKTARLIEKYLRFSEMDAWRGSSWNRKKIDLMNDYEDAIVFVLNYVEQIVHKKIFN